MVERLNGIQEASGSNPLISTKNEDNGTFRCPRFLVEIAGQEPFCVITQNGSQVHAKNAPRFCVNLAVETESLSPTDSVVTSSFHSLAIKFCDRDPRQPFLSRTVLRYNAKRFASSRKKNAPRFCVNLAVETESLSPPTVWSHLRHHFPAFKSCDRDPAAPSEAFGLWHLNDLNEVLTYNATLH